MTDELVKRHVEQLRLTGGDLADLCQPIADAIEALTAERDSYRAVLEGACYGDIDSIAKNTPEQSRHLGEAVMGLTLVVRSRAEAAEADNARLREAIDYILDGMGIAGPDYDIDPGDDFLDAANSKWVRDTLTRLAAALKGETT